MIRQRYKCTLLSDIVMTQTAATEGFNPTLDYIPGAKFLGIVASQLYGKEDNSSTLDLFHNGTIHFGDAHPIINGKKSLKVPSSWFYAKGKSLDKGTWIGHYFTKEITEDLIKEGIQPKQARSGYFVHELGVFGNLMNVEKFFSIKSSYDRMKRRAKDEKMFGYNALGKGTAWEFHIEMENDTYTKRIQETLEGKRRVGRSRSAEYGLVEIELIEKTEIQASSIKTQEVFVYAASNLCFYNPLGQNTLQPAAQQLGIDINGASIQWDKSQIRHRIYQTWNQHRFNRDADRVIIEKGSVFVVKIPENNVKEMTVPQKVGAHYSEGFGKVIWNPEFLYGNEKDAKLVTKFPIKKIDLSKQKESLPIFEGQYPVKETVRDDAILNAIKARKNRKDKTYDIDELVNQFKDDYPTEFSQVTKSQWGALRSYAKGCKNWNHFHDLVFDDTVGFLNSGKMKKQWENCKITLKDHLELYKKKNENDVLNFAQKLFAEMQKG